MPLQSQFFPENTERIIQQVMAGPTHVKVEGIGCTSCHLINGSEENTNSHPTFKLNTGTTFFGPYEGAEDNLAHLSEKARIYEGANYCTTCHFRKVRDVTAPQLRGAILKDLVCQDCPIGRSTESSTIEQGSLSRPIGHHWCQRLVNPGLMLSNRYVQVECSSRLEIEVKEIPKMVVGTVHISNGALTHKFTEGDPVLKQVLLNVTLRNRTGKNIGQNQQSFGRTFDELLRGPIFQPSVNGGTTRHLPLRFTVPQGVTPDLLEASVSHALIPDPGTQLTHSYLATLPEEGDRRNAEDIIDRYSSFRLLTFRTMSLKST